MPPGHQLLITFGNQFMRNSLFIIFIFFAVGFARAQNTAVTVLQRSLAKMESLKSVEYQLQFVYTNPLSKGDTSIGKKNVKVVFGLKGVVTAMNGLTTLNNGQGKYAEIYRGDTLYTVDHIDSIYSFDNLKKGTVTTDMASVTDLIKTGISKPSILSQKKDTTVNGKLCFSFMLKTYDKMVSGHRSYTYKYLVIDKKTLMPVYTRENSEGVLEKGGYVIGRVSMFSEEHYNNYRINQKINPEVFAFDKTGFDLKNSKMLVDGDIAPDLNVLNLTSQAVPASQFKNKVVLVEFGATDCAANALANPMLNRLHEKYASDQFTIACIYTNESAKQVANYAAANTLKFPMYLGNKKLKRAFKTIAVPNFYVIDKNGRVVKAFSGFSDELEAGLSGLIEAKTQ